MIKKVSAYLIAATLAVAGLVGIGTPAFAVTSYTYAGGKQTLAAGTTATGVGANALVAKPYTASTDHSMMELAAMDTGAAINHVIGVGWNIDPALYGDTDPHLFAEYFAGGTWGGYNGAGGFYVDNPSNATNLGANLATVASATYPANIKAFKVYYDGATQCGSTAGVFGWWVSYDNTAVGCYKDTAWSSSGGFVASQARVFQAFGEVYSGASAMPCTDMGNGKGATSYVAPHDATDPAAVFSVTILGTSPATATDLSLYATNASKYSAVRISSPTTTSFTYGGPGWNVAGTATGSTGSC